jgi:hypothetical protein
MMENEKFGTKKRSGDVWVAGHHDPTGEAFARSQGGTAICGGHRSPLHRKEGIPVRPASAKAMARQECGKSSAWARLGSLKTAWARLGAPLGDLFFMKEILRLTTKQPGNEVGRSALRPETPSPWPSSPSGGEGGNPHAEPKRYRGGVCRRGVSTRAPRVLRRYATVTDRRYTGRLQRWNFFRLFPPFPPLTAFGGSI